jgi:hypothetical protein
MNACFTSSEMELKMKIWVFFCTASFCLSIISCKERLTPNASAAKEFEKIPEASLFKDPYPYVLDVFFRDGIATQGNPIALVTKTPSQECQRDIVYGEMTNRCDFMPDSPPSGLEYLYCSIWVAHHPIENVRLARGSVFVLSGHIDAGTHLYGFSHVDPAKSGSVTISCRAGKDDPQGTFLAVPKSFFNGIFDIRPATRFEVYRER